MSIMSPLPLTLPRLRPRREPLSSLPISLFIPPAHTLPSPISIPSKRASSSTDDIQPRKVSRAQDAESIAVVVASGSGSGSRTIRKAKSMGRLKDKDVTPRARAVLDRDEMGTGRSPARRLFVGASNDDDRSISGISGAISTPPSNQPQRSLAQSSPILNSPQASSSRSPFVVDPNLPEGSALDLTVPGGDQNVDIHDPGFAIHADTVLATGLRTPRSRRAPPNHTAISAPILSLPSSPSSPSSPSRFLENQENIPPPALTIPPYSPSKSRSYSHSVHSTPSKHSSYDESDVSAYLSAPSTCTSTSASGSGTRRRERSKLMNEVMILRGETASMIRSHDEEDDKAVDGDEGDELTPGRKVLRKGKERERLLGEVDCV